MYICIPVAILAQAIWLKRSTEISGPLPLKIIACFPVHFFLIGLVCFSPLTPSFATFLSLLSWIGSTATFLVYGGLAIFTFFWMFAILPETKGYTLEEIEANLARGGRKNWLPPSGEDASID